LERDSLALAQRLYLQLRSQFVELRKKRCGNRHAVTRSLVVALGPAVAWQSDRIDAGKTLRGA
jgi:hypothetical protein